MNIKTLKSNKNIHKVMLFNRNTILIGSKGIGNISVIKTLKHPANVANVTNVINVTNATNITNIMEVWIQY